MIQFITNHPIWTGIILYLIIGFILGIQYYLRETYRELIDNYTIYTKRKIISEYAGLAFIHIFFWFLFMIGDIWDLDTSLHIRYGDKEDMLKKDKTKDWPENY